VNIKISVMRNGENLSGKNELSPESNFDFVFRLHYPALCRFAFSYLKDENIAADFVQDIFLQIWDTDSLSENLPHLQPWLYTLVRNRCIDALRRKNTQDKRVGDYSRYAAGWLSEEIDEVTRAETIRQLHQALNTLPGDTAKIIRMHFFEGKKYTEIAQEMGLNYDVVQKRAARGLAQLKKLVGPQVLLLLLSSASCFV
jgi:RNA polymerase sigma-70 factor (family 1)